MKLHDDIHNYYEKLLIDEIEKQKIVLSLGAKRFLRKPLDKEELAMTLFELGYL